MWNINTGEQAKGTSSAINYNTTRGQNSVDIPILGGTSPPVQTKSCDFTSKPGISLVGNTDVDQ